MTIKRNYDSRCFELAEYFLVDEPRRVQERASDLAQHIQDSIENWFDIVHDENEPDEAA